MELTKEFLENTYSNEDTKRNYSSILNKAKKFEDEFQKELHEFSPEEWDKVMMSFKRGSFHVVLVIISCLKSYLDYCKVDNYFKDYESRELIEKYVDNNFLKSRIFTMKDLEKHTKKLVNPQDAVLLPLFFLGLTKKEVLNLEVSQIKKNEIHLEDRVIKIPKEFQELIQRAIEQDEYIVNNGNASPSIHAPSLKLNTTPYLLRTAGKTKYDFKENTLSLRLKNLKRFLKNKQITSNNLRLSGMFHKLNQIKNPKSKDYQKLFTDHGRSHFNWYALKRFYTSAINLNLKEINENGTTLKRTI
jgi:hypothetical protein